MVIRHAAIAIAAASLNMEVVQSALTMLANGESPYTLEGVEQKSPEKIDELPKLANCTPAVGKGSSRRYVQIEFFCDGGDGPYMHQVSFSPSKDDKVRIYIGPLPSAVGPSAAASDAEDLPSELNQFRRFIRAVKKGEDASLGGLLPLNLIQNDELSTLAECSWMKPVETIYDAQTWISFVRCSHHERNQGRMVEVQFDEEGRALVIRIGYGTRVRR